MFRPVETNVDLSRLQFSDYSNRGLQVADYSKVEFLVPSDSEEDEFDDDAMEYAHAQGKLSLSGAALTSHAIWWTLVLTRFQMELRV